MWLGIGGAIRWGVNALTISNYERARRYYVAVSLWLARCQAHIKTPRKYSSRYRAYIHLSRVFEKQNFSLGQLNWARAHDWFISGDLNAIICRNEWIKDGVSHVETVTHTNFKTLRDWAGY